MFENLRKVTRLTRNGVKRPILVLREAKRANLNPEYALALLELETNIPQQNIFGCDWGPRINNAPEPPYCGHDVTEARVVALMRNGLANGVGWTQLTYMPLVKEAHTMGGAHKPKYQMRVGFRLLASHQAALGVRSGFRAYNGSGMEAEEYADRAIQAAARWNRILGGWS